MLRKLCLFLLIVGLNLPAQTYNPAILKEILAEVQNSAAQPVVLFDIDDTLTDTRGRCLTILNELANQESFKRDYPEESFLLSQLVLSQMHYSMKDVYRDLQIKNQIFIEKAEREWAMRYYSGAYARIDNAIPGAVRYVQSLAEAGAYIVYLTGRDIPRMYEGTVQGLLKHEFPYFKKTKLIMKPSKELPDLEFKKDAFNEVAKLGNVIGVFENEPANINAMHAFFKNAHAVFLDTQHSSKPDVPEEGIDWIKNYE